jgi:acetyl esterase/lipase
MATPRTLAYGPDPNQQGDLYLPETTSPPVVCLLHGGFWRSHRSRDLMVPLAADLVARGFAVWNLEYRRIGQPGGGWPGTLLDVAAGIDHLAAIAEEGVPLDLTRVSAAGHSAGGHLALWSAARHRASAAGLLPPPRVRVAAAAGLGPVADLQRAFALRLGNDVVAELLGGSPSERPDAYRMADPIALLPAGARSLVVHGTADDVVPIEVGRSYVEAARAAGDDATLAALSGVGHLEFLDPRSEAHAVLCRWLGAGR